MSAKQLKSYLRAYTTQLEVPQQIEVTQNYAEGILNYGRYNVYPNQVLQIKRASGKTTQATALFQDFLYGNGFEDEGLQDLVVNKTGQTLDNILEKVANEYSIFYGFSIHLGYNLLGLINKISVIPFQYTRLCDPSEKFRDHIAIWDNWAYESYTDVTNNRDQIDYLPKVKDFSLESYESYIQALGGFKYFKGSVYWYSTEGPSRYPHCTFDPVLKDSETDAAYSNYRYRSIKNNFNASVIMRFLSEMTNEEKDEVLSQIKSFQGDENAGNIMALFGEATNIDGSPVSDVQVDSLTPTNSDGLYVNGEKSVNQNIVMQFRQPTVLHSLDDKGIFNQETLSEAYNFYNNITARHRRKLSKIFSQIIGASVWANVTDNYTIKPQTYM